MYEFNEKYEQFDPEIDAHWYNLINNTAVYCMFRVNRCLDLF